MSTPEVSPGSPVSSTQRRPGNAFVRWLLVRDDLDSARGLAAQFTPEQREYLRRAKLAFELGELSLAPGNAVRSGSTAPLAANLFRQAMYWAVLAQNSAIGTQTPEQVWASVDEATLPSLSANDGERKLVASAMSSTFVELADGPPENQRATADVLRRWATHLIANVQRVLWALEWLKLKRLLRLAALALVCLIPITLAALALMAKPDLAKGKPWRVSSVGIECHPEKSDCGGVTTDILFHTQLEPNPWFQYDFGAPLAFSSLTIRNRQDFGPERAVPLVVEVSNDGKHFHELIRRQESFSTWRPSFPTQHARYLRLRVDRESMLHLEAIKVHP